MNLKQKPLFPSHFEKEVLKLLSMLRTEINKATVLMVYSNTPDNNNAWHACFNEFKTPEWGLEKWILVKVVNVYVNIVLKNYFYVKLGTE